MTNQQTIVLLCSLVIGTLGVLLWYMRRVAVGARSVPVEQEERGITPAELQEYMEQNHQLAQTAPPEPALSSEGAIRAISERLAALEGMLPALRSQLDSYSALASRMAALEANIPTIADAYERFTDSTERQIKRDSERDRHKKKRETQNAGDAAQALLGLSGQGPPAAGAVPAAGGNNKRRGLVGGGGRGRAS